MPGIHPLFFFMQEQGNESEKKQSGLIIIFTVTNNKKTSATTVPRFHNLKMNLHYYSVLPYGVTYTKDAPIPEDTKYTNTHTGTSLHSQPAQTNAKLHDCMGCAYFCRNTFQTYKRVLRLAT